MSTIKEKLSKYHFIATEIDFKIQAENKKILAGDWCNNYSSLKNKNFEVVDDISQDIRGITFGDLIIGEVSEILDNNMVKILLYDNQSVNRNVTLAHRVMYVWIEDGYEKRIEDIELGLEYYQNYPEKLDSTKYQQLLIELKGLKDGTDRNRGERSGLGVVYTLDIIDVIDNVVVAKIISKNPPYTKVRLRDKIKIKYD